MKNDKSGWLSFSLYVYFSYYRAYETKGYYKYLILNRRKKSKYNKSVAICLVDNNCFHLNIIYLFKLTYFYKKSKNANLYDQGFLTCKEERNYLDRHESCLPH